jgi:peptidoglycan/xylan/chitin deacetylase (PgdA/CDA1 family)
MKRAGQHVMTAVGSVLGPLPAGGLGIFMYHRVFPGPAGACAPTWNVPPARFRAQLAGLLARGYRAWPLRRALEHAGAGRPLPSRTFVVTLDDGYANACTHALPVLRDLGVPATVFLATAYLDREGTFPFDDWPGAGRPGVPPDSYRPLTTAQCAALQASGLVELGAHTHTHECLCDRPDAFGADLAASVRVLQSRFGVARPTFAFPFGVVNPGLVAAARQAGVACSLTVDAALVRPGSDPFAWGRFVVEASDTPSSLAARLDGWSGLGRGVWNWLGRPGDRRPTPAERGEP